VRLAAKRQVTAVTERAGKAEQYAESLAEENARIQARAMALEGSLAELRLAADRQMCETAAVIARLKVQIGVVQANWGFRLASAITPRK
jgi:hypothetical protein